MLLTYSSFPIRENCTELCQALAEAQDIDEINAWIQFLENVLIRRRPERKAWQDLLETVLAHPQNYTSRILTAAIERYTTLADEPNLSIKEEIALGLPVQDAEYRTE